MYDQKKSQEVYGVKQDKEKGGNAGSVRSMRNNLIIAVSAGTLLRYMSSVNAIGTKKFENSAYLQIGKCI